MSNIRVFLIDDQEIIRSGLRRLLQSEPEFEVVGEAADAQEALRLIPETRADVVLMDIKMPGMDGIEATRRLRELVPTAKVLVLTAYADDFAAAALKAGAQGFLIKDITGQELIRAVRSVTQGTSPIHLSVPTADLSSVMGRLQNHKSALSPRQLEVLRLVAAGDSNAEIARKLNLGERTVKRELSEIFQKLGVDSRAKAVASAYEHRLI